MSVDIYGIIKRGREGRTSVRGGKQPPNRRAFKRMAPFGGKSFAVLWRAARQFACSFFLVLMGKRAPERARKLSHKMRRSPRSRAARAAAPNPSFPPPLHLRRSGMSTKQPSGSVTASRAMNNDQLRRGETRKKTCLSNPRVRRHSAVYMGTVI